MFEPFVVKTVDELRLQIAEVMFQLAQIAMHSDEETSSEHKIFVEYHAVQDLSNFHTAQSERYSSEATAQCCAAHAC